MQATQSVKFSRVKLAAANLIKAWQAFRKGEPLKVNKGTRRQRVTAISTEELTDSINQHYTALRNDPEAWEEELKERELWDQTLNDGKSVR